MTMLQNSPEVDTQPQYLQMYQLDLISLHPSNSNFAISPSGVITTTVTLLPASTHDVIVVASDHGSPPLTSSAVVTISVMGSHLASPPLDIIWDGTGLMKVCWMFLVK
uniref:Cadherin domain-containing protein n=1 Tax=Caenorhabditis tropicalis TaxID=1561998 RepID=A0A1I7UPC4_9PELO